MKAAILAAVLVFGAGRAGACDIDPAGVERIESDRFVLSFRPVPAPIAVGGHFALDIVACGRNGAPAPDSVRVDAWMPEHRHGMNYKPVVQRTAPDHWRADGLMFHMPGLWEFRFDLRAAGSTDRLTHVYRLD